MPIRLLSRLLPEHPLGLALAPPSRTGSPEEIFAEVDRAHWLGIANAGRVCDLLRDYRAEMVTAAMRGVPVLLALQSCEDAILAERWLAELRPDWTMRHSVELLDELESRGRFPTLETTSAQA